MNEETQTNQLSSPTEEEDFNFQSSEEKEKYEEAVLNNQEALLQDPVAHQAEQLDPKEKVNQPKVLKLEPISSKNKKGFISLITLISIIIASIGLTSFVAYLIISR